MIELPEKFQKNIIDLYGDQGRDWLLAIPETVAKCADYWDIQVQEPFPDLSYHYLAPAINLQNQAVVLKLGLPDQEFVCEMEALTIFNGNGCVRLLEVDRQRGWLLLEHLQPGIPLSLHPCPREMARITAVVIQRLHTGSNRVSSIGPFPTAAQWGKGLQHARNACRGENQAIPGEMIARAGRYFQEMIESSREPILLHGDLHPENILQAERESWLAIDPKGVIGDPAYEVGAYLRNLLPYLDHTLAPGREINHHLSIFERLLGYDHERMLKWGYAQAVLAAWWSVEDHGEPEARFLQAARLMGELIPN